MNWQNICFDWNRARAFLVTAEEGSLSAAARALGMAQPTLGRQVSALEEELGVLLFDRVGRGLALTEAGALLAEHVRAMALAADGVARVASGQSQELEGLVAVTASEIYAGWLLPPILKALRDKAPGIRVDVIASNAVRDLKRREADIAIRNTRPEQPDLIARKIAEDAAGLFAAPDYLHDIGTPEAAEDLARADFIGFEQSEPMIGALRTKGLPVRSAQFRITASTHPVHLEMVRAGLGIGLVPAPLGAGDPALRRVLPDIAFDYPVWLVAHREVQTNPRIRIVWDLLAEHLPRLLKGEPGKK